MESLPTEDWSYSFAGYDSSVFTVRFGGDDDHDHNHNHNRNEAQGMADAIHRGKLMAASAAPSSVTSAPPPSISMNSGSGSARENPTSLRHLRDSRIDLKY